MPIYEYQCQKCGPFETTQRITDKPLRKCPTCKGKVKKLISNTSFQLKGTGWYVTDYARKGQNGADSKGENGSKSSSESKTESKTESKPESAKSGNGSKSSTPSKTESKSESKTESTKGSSEKAPSSASSSGSAS
jgi:putative FmdB family regulatory protein